MRFELVHRKLKKCLYVYLGETKDRGFGVFAAKPFKKGEVILVDEDGDYYDQVVSYAELLRLGCGLDKTIQVGPDAFKLPISEGFPRSRRHSAEIFGAGGAARVVLSCSGGDGRLARMAHGLGTVVITSGVTPVTAHAERRRVACA